MRKRVTEQREVVTGSERKKGRSRRNRERMRGVFAVRKEEKRNRTKESGAKK